MSYYYYHYYYQSALAILYFSIGQEINILIFNSKIEKIRAVFSFLVIFTRKWENSGVFMTLSNMYGETIFAKSFIINTW